MADRYFGTESNVSVRVTTARGVCRITVFDASGVKGSRSYQLSLASDDLWTDEPLGLLCVQAILIVYTAFVVYAT